MYQSLLEWLQNLSFSALFSSILFFNRSFNGWFWFFLQKVTYHALWFLRCTVSVFPIYQSKSNQALKRFFIHLAIFAHSSLKSLIFISKDIWCFTALCQYFYCIVDSGVFLLIYYDKKFRFCLFVSFTLPCSWIFLCHSF